MTRRLADARRSTLVDDDIGLLASITGLSSRTVTKRVDEAHGNATMLAIFADEWPEDAETLGEITVSVAKRAELEDEIADATDVPELELVVDAAEVRRAVRLVRGQLMLASTERRRQAVGFRGGNVTTTIHWCAPLKTWSLFQRLGNRYWNCFGTSRPDKNKALPIVVEVNPPLEGMNRQMGGAFARDPSSGDVYFVHRGRIGGGQRGIGAELFWSRFRGGVAMREVGRDRPARVVVVGKVGAPEFARDVAGFVHEVGRIKGATAG